MREIHIRRLRYDEAKAKLEREVEEAYLAGETSVDIVHGIGGGILQKMAREFVESSSILREVPQFSNPGVLRAEVLSPGKDTIRNWMRR